MATANTDAARDLLRQAGQRVTKARVAVLCAVLAAGTEHVSADDLLAQVAATTADVHRATVYRTLDSLTDAGVLRHVHLDRGLRAYHLAGSGRPRAHLHAQCSRCGTVVDLPAEVLGNAAVRIRAATGFELDAGHAALSGLCAACAQK